MRIIDFNRQKNLMSVYTMYTDILGGRRSKNEYSRAKN